jgi:hypothetical protein
MRIGVIGGVERYESQYHRLAAKENHDLEFHGGHLAGRGVNELEALIVRADLVVIVTDVNSHGAVQLARRMVRRHGRRSLLLRRCGLSKFNELLDTLRTESAQAAGTG